MFIRLRTIFFCMSNVFYNLKVLDIGYLILLVSRYTPAPPEESMKPLSRDSNFHTPTPCLL